MATSTIKPDERESVAAEDLNHEVGLYRHSKRPEWGMAILAWEKGGRRAYQFQDGRLRKFKDGYYSLLEPVGQVEGSEEAIVRRLNEAIEASRGGKRGKALEPVAAFQEQVDLFEEMYPEGFQGEKWIADHRRDPRGRALKRHREPSSEETRTRLSRENCETWIANNEHGEILKAALEILGGTSLVALRHVKTLRELEGDDVKEFADLLAALLHGDGEFPPRFNSWIEFLERVLDGRPSWRLATALPALMYPEDHVCVRRSAFIRQAATVAPTAKYTKKPQSRPYKNYLRVSQAVKTRLEGAGHQPRDLLDIHDFVWDTLRNAALDSLGDDDSDDDDD